jgi:hypothetical protein
MAMVWEIVFMLVLLKIPMIYICVVIWWAIKAEPTPTDLDQAPVVDDTPPPGGPPRRRSRPHRRPLRPHAPRRGAVSPVPQRGSLRK